jgi:hypothetical protein
MMLTLTKKLSTRLRVGVYVPLMRRMRALNLALRLAIALICPLTTSACAMRRAQFAQHALMLTMRL